MGMFFPSSSGGNCLSRQAVQNKLRTLIAAENRAHPLSDSVLEKQLCAEGVVVSRRAVAKYRAELGIPSAAERKR